MLERHFASEYPRDARFEQIKEIIAFIKEGNGAQVVGLPGGGKSNILELLAYNKQVRLAHLGATQKHVHFVLMNFAEVRGKPLLEITKFLFLELVDSLSEREMNEEYKEAKAILLESLTYQDELILFQGLKKAIDYLSGVKELTIVFLFDRFETYIPFVTSEFFSNLRILRNRAKYKFSAVFSLNRPLEEVLEPSVFADYYEFLAGKIIYIPLRDTVIQEFRLTHFIKTTGKTITQEERETVDRLTGGHGKLFRVCLEFLASFAQTPEKLNSTLFLSFKPVLGALYEIWLYLTPSEQQNILRSARDTDGDFLTRIGLLKHGDITIPLFKDFLSQKRQELTGQSGKIAFDPLTNNITKGGHSISDRLTVSELRLLKVLLENINTIVDRETIISSVWKDAKATAGVTDQAVDQLVFRLRKKIEDDPNSPVFLHTIKGRGIKFTQ